MNTAFSAKSASQSRSTSEAPEQQPLAQVIRRNLAGGDCPLDYLASSRESITELMAYLLEHYELPEPVALEFEAALACASQMEVHLKQAATRCA